MVNDPVNVSRETLRRETSRAVRTIGKSSFDEASTPLAVEVAQIAEKRVQLAGIRYRKPEITRIMSVVNQKGGVGKTTTTVNLAAALAQGGMRVLVLDMDPQGNASTALNIPHTSGTPSIYDILINNADFSDIIQPCRDVENLYCAPATIDLSGAEIELVSLEDRATQLKSKLYEFLQEQKAKDQERFDYILIDCPPSLGLLTINAFVAAREVLIPIQCEYYALEGLSQLLRNIELIQAHMNPSLELSTILLTMFDGRTKLSSQVADEVSEHFPKQTLNTKIPRNVRISEAPSYGQTVLTYDRHSAGALAYIEAAKEITEMEK